MKDNKLIAEFMGHEFTLMPDTDGKCYTEKDSWDIIHEDDFIVDGGWYAYNTSWNGLMPVVEKISDAKSWSINATLEWLSESQDIPEGFCRVRKSTISVCICERAIYPS
jgi:hypothetical protein